MPIRKDKRIKTILFLSLVTLLLLVPSVQARSHKASLFKYVAGTESMPKGCEGKLEVTGAALVFESAEGSITVPYASISHMEYGEKVSKQVRKMKLNWAIKPSASRSKHEGYFTVLYSQKGETRAIILKVATDTMRPYLAEIDLKTGLTIKSGRD
ncbi:MAG: hypothetical protein P8Z30_05300 [Acidobacteriota bacterium]